MKKVFSIALAMVMSLSLMIPASAASAPNQRGDSTDRQFSFIFSQNRDKTGFTTKYDSTATYMKCYSATHPYSAGVFAGPPESGIISSVSSEYYFDTGTTRYMPVAYNSGDVVYGIRATADYWDASAWGYWSPDSVGS